MSENKLNGIQKSLNSVGKKQDQVLGVSNGGLFGKIRSSFDKKPREVEQVETETKPAPIKTLPNQNQNVVVKTLPNQN
ncbi:MAG: hypothetical protein R3Y33_04575, partial [Clostridia bacterium]